MDVVDGVKLASLEEGAFSLLASLVFPSATPEALRICCDYMNVLFVVDDITDDQDGARAREREGWRGATVLRASTLEGPRRVDAAGGVPRAVGSRASARRSR